jgi:hypothetical protein
MLSGEHHSQVLGAPKTRNFAHLIEHGGNDGSGKTAVCVDRHALSAAIGRRATDDDFAQANLSAAPSAADKKAGHTEGHRYRMVADAYRHAASQLSEETGQNIEPHHVQAVTWVMQRDQNDEAEKHETDPNRQKLIKGRITKNTGETKRWHAHVAEQYPEFLGQEHWKMTSLDPRFAYNEVRAPQDVDTLRDESCAICGNDIAFDGRECQVCGYIKPPKALDDPDVDKAKQLDQLKQNIVGERNLSGADPSQPGADFDAGNLDDTEPGGDNSAAPWLSCQTCGTDVRPAAAQTTSSEPATAQPAGLADGDPCPVCGEGPLMSTGVSEDDTDEQQEQAAEEGEPPDPDAVTEEEDPEEDETSDSDDSADSDDPKKKPGKNPAGKATAAMKVRDHSKEFPMQHGLASLANLQKSATDQQALIDSQQRYIAQLQRKTAQQGSQIQRLSACVTTIARILGPQADTLIRQAAMTKRADEQNPAQPIPEPAAQPPVQTTVQAETPEAFADVRAPGMVPGANQDVAADAVTTAYTPGADIQTAPVRQLVDVTAPVEGTQGPRPLSEVKTLDEVRVGNPMNPQVAFPLGGDFAQAQRTGAVQVGYANEQTQATQPVQVPQQRDVNQIRSMSSIRLARLRLAANLEQGSIETGADLSIGQRIANDPNYSMERIQQEIETLNNVRTAAARASAPMPPRGAVPRPSVPVHRVVPSLASQGGGFHTTASARQSEDDDLAAALM